jgi:flagellar FliL protein
MSAAAAAAEAPAGKKPGGKKKLVIMVAVAAIVLGGGGVGARVYMKKQKAAAEAAAADDGDASGDAGAPKAEKKKEHNAHPVFVPMDPFVVNLADHEADRYAQIGIVLEVPDEHVGEEIKTYLPAIRNNILLLLAHKSSADLAGGEGKELLAKQIRREALKAMGEEVEAEEEEEPVAAHPAVAEGASAVVAPAKKKKKKKVAEAADSPIRSVQFSSFIIQ